MLAFRSASIYNRINVIKVIKYSFLFQCRDDAVIFMDRKSVLFSLRTATFAYRSTGRSRIAGDDVCTAHGLRQNGFTRIRSSV